MAHAAPEDKLQDVGAQGEAVRRPQQRPLPQRSLAQRDGRLEARHVAGRVLQDVLARRQRLGAIAERQQYVGRLAVHARILQLGARLLHGVLGRLHCVTIFTVSRSQQGRI